MGKKGKHKIKNESSIPIILPVGTDVFGIVDTMLGHSRLKVKCMDGKMRLCRIRGKMKKRVWIKKGDIVLVSPWDFQSDTRGDIFYRYTRVQVSFLKRKGYLII